MTEAKTRHGLMSSLRQLVGTVLETVQVRLSLLSNEIEREKLRLFDGLLLSVLALMLLCLGLLMLGGFIVVLFWDSYRLQVLGALSCTFLIAGSWLLFSARAGLRQSGGLFSHSVTELGQDLDSIRSDQGLP
jgi:uncharacterized membrane protein YqjE